MIIMPHLWIKVQRVSFNSARDIELGIYTSKYQYLDRLGLEATIEIGLCLLFFIIRFGFYKHSTHKGG